VIKNPRSYLIGDKLTNMANLQHLAKLKEGATAWNSWSAKYDLIPDLTGANLAGADLRVANLRSARLSGADLSECDLSKANLEGADLSGAVLSGATLRRTYLTGADLTDADLRGGAEVSVSRLQGAVLCGAKLNGANLDRSDFLKANLSGADLSGAYLGGANLSFANLSKAILKGAILRSVIAIQTNFAGADLSGSYVYGISAWDLNLEGTIQSSLVITGEGEDPPIQVDDLEVAQFIYLLLNRKRLRKVITTLGEKAVLILGRFTERKELLDGIANELRSLGYLPIILDFERPTDRDLTETVRILAGLSRFVIADITNPRSVPLELQATVPEYVVPFVTIAQRGQPRFSMFDDLPAKYHWALPLLEYNTPQSLLAAFKEKVELPALEKLEEVRRLKAMPSPVRSAED